MCESKLFLKKKTTFKNQHRKPHATFKISRYTKQYGGKSLPVNTLPYPNHTHYFTIAQGLEGLWLSTQPLKYMNLEFQESHVSTSSSIVVENPQEETRWYWKHFLGNGLQLFVLEEKILKILEHQNFSGIDPSTKSPFFLSIMVEEEIDDNRLCRAVLWTQKVNRILSHHRFSNFAILLTKEFMILGKTIIFVRKYTIFLVK